MVSYYKHPYMSLKNIPLSVLSATLQTYEEEQNANWTKEKKKEGLETDVESFYLVILCTMKILVATAAATSHLHTRYVHNGKNGLQVIFGIG